MIPDVKKSIPYTVCKKALLHQPFFLQACEDSIPDNDMVQQVKIHKGTGSGYLLCQLNIRYGRVRKSAGMIMYQNDFPGLKANGPPHDFLDIRRRRVHIATANFLFPHKAVFRVHIAGIEMFLTFMAEHFHKIGRHSVRSIEIRQFPLAEPTGKSSSQLYGRADGDRLICPDSRDICQIFPVWFLNLGFPAVFFQKRNHI